MYKMMAFVFVLMMGTVQVLTDCMLVGSIIQAGKWQDYFVGMGALVIVSAWGLWQSVHEWREECKK